ncbi:MAG: hypothetical protein JSW73_05470 [Candidatus Woesearchaeota archaeon]|nr:MAG: hypothetical protein JSW73_05470 [Candidatus Woesearchaeota archaeon]
MELTKDLAEFIGICIGDGCISVNKRYSELSVCGDSIEEREYYDKTVIPLFNKTIGKPLLDYKLSGRDYSKNGVYGFKIFNKAVVDYLRNIGLKPGKKTNIEIPERLMTESLIRNVLRGIFDTDGTVYFNKSTSGKHTQPRIKISSTSKNLIFQIKQISEKLGFRPYFKKPYKGKRDLNPVYSLVLYKKEDINRWIKEIGFNNPKHTSKIDIWKKIGKGLPRSNLKERKSIIFNLYNNLNTETSKIF